MRTVLKNHNRIAYNKVMAALAKSRMTCVCHPTGTGKSYIAAAVCEKFDKVLILAPNDFVLKQQKDVLEWKSGVIYRSYQWLIKNIFDITEKYDLIILDEFHRAGADEWGAAVKMLIESQPQAKVLGTTATPIRYLNKGRDMSDELFAGNVASQLSIPEAWAHKILPIPTYVAGIFSFDEMVADTVRRINKSYRISDKTKQRRIQRLSNARLEWEKSSGMAGILRRHLDSSTKRVLVFCPRIEWMHQMKQTILGWFHDAGLNVTGCFEVSSNNTDREQHEQMDAFVCDSGDGMHVMLSVNVLNEGVHIPGVNAVLMLRTTDSRTIYLQQLGRCLTAATTESPIVLDMVDNVTTTSAIHGFTKEFEAVKKKPEFGEVRQLRFDIFDYTLSVRQLISKLVPQEVSFLSAEERLKIIKDFIKEHGRLPKIYERDVYRHLTWLRIKCPDNPELQEILRQYAPRYGQKKRTLEEKKRLLFDFYDKHGRTPYGTRKEENTYSYIWDNLRKYHADDPDVKKFIEWNKIRIDAEKEAKFEREIKSIEDFCRENGRLPIQSREGEGHLSDLWYRLKKLHADHPMVKAIQEQYGRRGNRTQKERQQLLTAACKRLGCLPSPATDDDAYHIYKEMKKRPCYADFIAQLEKKYKQGLNVQTERKLARIKAVIADTEAFARKNGYLPDGHGSKLGNAWRSVKLKNPKHPDVKRLCKEYPSEYQFMLVVKAKEDVKEIEAFRAEHGKLTKDSNLQLYRKYTRLKRGYGHLPEVQKL